MKLLYSIFTMLYLFFMEGESMKQQLLILVEWAKYIPAFRNLNHNLFY
jgi:hypothetical protein